MSQPEFLTLHDGAARSRLAADLVVLDGWAFLSGVQPADLKDDRVPLPESVEEQTRKVLANMEAILESRGMRRQNVVAVRVHLVELQRFYARMNDAYAGFFAAGRLPARSCIGVVGLPRGALVQMDFIARKGST